MTQSKMNAGQNIDFFEIEPVHVGDFTRKTETPKKQNSFIVTSPNHISPSLDFQKKCGQVTSPRSSTRL